jgi:hypothetical protein
VSEDVIRVIHAERVYCLSLFIRILIMRHRFSDLVAERAVIGEQDQSEKELDAMTVAHSAALQLISTQLQIAQKGLMTYCKPTLSVAISMSYVCRSSRWGPRDSPTHSSGAHPCRVLIELPS